MRVWFPLPSGRRNSSGSSRSRISRRRLFSGVRCPKIVFSYDPRSITAGTPGLPVDGGRAHVSLDAAVAGLPPTLRGVRPSGLPHTPWDILEHMRVGAWRFWNLHAITRSTSRRGHPSYPPPRHLRRQRVGQDILKHSQSSDLRRMVKNPQVNLHARIPHGTGQTVPDSCRRRIILYHLGQLILVRQAIRRLK